MKKESKQFLIGITIVLAVAITISHVLFSYVFESGDFPGRIGSIFFVFLLTCATYYWLMKTVADKPKAFGKVFMMQTGGRLLLYITCILCYLVFYKQYAVSFVAHFFGVYFLFAICEVIFILRFVKNNSGQMLGDTKTSN